jgi:hypothetical protein
MPADRSLASSLQLMRRFETPARQRPADTGGVGSAHRQERPVIRHVTRRTRSPMSEAVLLALITTIPTILTASATVLSAWAAARSQRRGRVERTVDKEG